MIINWITTTEKIARSVVIDSVLFSISNFICDPMTVHVAVYRHVIANIKTGTPGFIIGSSDPELIIVVSTLSCLDIKIAEQACPAGLSVIGRYGDNITDRHGLCCCLQDGTLSWTLEGTSVEPVPKDGDPFEEFVILFTALCRSVISKMSTVNLCRVFDGVLEVDDDTVCQKLLPKKSNLSESVSHPFSFASIGRVLPVDILVASSLECTSAPQLILSDTRPDDIVDVIAVVKPDLKFASAFQLLLSEVERIAAFPNLCNHHYYGLPNVHAPIAVLKTTNTDRNSVALDFKIDCSKALRFVCPWTKGQRLYNVHRFVRPSGLTDNIQSLVYGSYGYYHYLQDGFNDDGWGCAYRSLQTLWSWALFQGFTQEVVPDFRKIQEIICSSDDKPKSFIGSRQWIGAIEVNYALSSVGILCKILPLSSGAEFATKGRDLAQHFDLHGSPVMIGGGVLAYTLLGVDVNEFTGDIRFLILDPHYKGDDDIDVIIKSGWCAWRSSDLFDQTAFYNLCIPQNPNVIK